MKIAVEQNPQHPVVTGTPGQQIVATSPLSPYGDGTKVHPSLADKLPKKRPRKSSGGGSAAPVAPNPATYNLPPLPVGRQVLGKKSGR